MSDTVSNNASPATEVTKEAGRVKLPFKEMVSYSFTDMAGNLLYVTLSSYIMYFYTDVFGISASGALGAATILLVARFADAISAVVWGSIVDHTRTKWGQCRPWFLWLAVPFAVTVFIAFTAPSLPNETSKFWYALVTYVLAAGAVYTGIQTPITAILPNLTSDPVERNNANSFRMLGGNIGSFITSAFTIPLVGFFGTMLGGGDRSGFMAALYGVIAIVLLVLAFRNLRERNYHPEVQKPIPFKDSLRAAKGNWPWVILVTAFVIYWIAQSTRNGMAVYYAKYNLGNENLTSLFNGVQVIGIVGTIAMPILANKLKNKTLTMIIGLAIGAIGQLLMPLAGSNVPLALTFWTIGVIGAAIACGMPFGMLADTVDYGEWKTGIHAAGFLTAVCVLHPGRLRLRCVPAAADHECERICRQCPAVAAGAERHKLLLHLASGDCIRDCSGHHVLLPQVREDGADDQGRDRRPSCS